MTDDRRPPFTVIPGGGRPPAPADASAPAPAEPAPVAPGATLPDSAGAPLVMEERIDPWRVASLHDSLGREGPAPEPGDPLPPLWHFLFFPEVRKPDGLGVDGHPRPGGFLPDTGLPRRMRAGGRMEFLSPLPIGAEARRVSAIQNVAIKQGGSGSLAIVTVRHEISGPDGLAMREEEDLVYRAAPGPSDKPRGPAPAKDETPGFSRAFTADPVLLFRYSALTFNGHRIHYDLPYATQEEGYPERVVHGPLMAQLLADLLRDETGRWPARFDYRAVSPIFCGQTFRLCGRTFGDQAELWVLNPDGRLALEAKAKL
ncbi:MAG: acyl-CoA dehydrogenase [Pseudomonadota bacterium]|nr:acyl-CoA dehydrogenase [Pseudomonadota bacterium]